MNDRPTLLGGERNGEPVVAIGAEHRVRPLLTVCSHGCRVGGGFTPREAIGVFGYLVWLAVPPLPE